LLAGVSHQLGRQHSTATCILSCLSLILVHNIILMLNFRTFVYILGSSLVSRLKIIIIPASLGQRAFLSPRVRERENSEQCCSPNSYAYWSIGLDPLSNCVTFDSVDRLPCLVHSSTPEQAPP
jgi:hypothetical protein